LRVLNSEFDQPLKLNEVRAIAPHAGGLMQQGYQCGILWGAPLATGAQVYRLFGSGPRAETAAVFASQRLVESFRTRAKHIDCLEITHTDFQKKSAMIKMMLKGGPITCVRLVVGYAPDAYREITIALSETNIEAPSPPVSCAVMLAQKMGVSEMHTVMLAGFAGGIGLSGSACGALGAAMWIIGMNNPTEGGGLTAKMYNPKVRELVDRFIKSKTADFRFECSEIVGRRFDNIADHSAYLHDGGCSELIELLAAS